MFDRIPTFGPREAERRGNKDLRKKEASRAESRREEKRAPTKGALFISPNMKKCSGEVVR